MVYLVLGGQRLRIHGPFSRIIKAAEIAGKLDAGYFIEHIIAEHYHWTHQDIMNLTDGEITYYLATLIIHDLEYAKKASSKKFKKGRGTT